MVDVVMSLIHCCHKSCGLPFMVTSDWETRRRESHEGFFCPNGHIQYFLGETKAEKLQRELNNANQQIARAEDETAEALKEAERERRASARLKKRVMGGTCPCCQRTFENVARHMATKHPNVTPIKKTA